MEERKFTILSRLTGLMDTSEKSKCVNIARVPHYDCKKLWLNSEGVNFVKIRLLPASARNSMEFLPSVMIVRIPFIELE